MYKLKPKILDASLGFVTKHGWSKIALASGAEAMQLPHVSFGLFHKGPVELVHHHMEKSNTLLIQQIKSSGNKYISYKNLVSDLLFYRILLNKEYQQSWPQAMALGARPENVTNTLSLIHALSFDIYKAQFNPKLLNHDYYSDYRLNQTSIGAIFAAGETYFLSDYSKDFIDTKKFLEVKVSQAQSVEKVLNYGTAVGEGAFSVFSSFSHQVFKALTEQTAEKFVVNEKERKDDQVKEEQGFKLPGDLFHSFEKGYKQVKVMTSDQAEKIILDYEPEAIVVKTNIDETFEPITNLSKDSKPFVRLIVDNADIVLDVLTK
eukprot:maker-scaffold_33-snap-gene-2.8-mRNA-1 protein AED:0.00 eAED:0.00 QI:75/1/1/1/1/1/2/484/318